MAFFDRNFLRTKIQNLVENSGLTLAFFQHLTKTVCLFSRFHLFDEKSSDIFLQPFLECISCFSGCFQHFVSMFGFQQFDYDGIIIFVFVLLLIHWHIESKVDILHLIWKVFDHYLFKYFSPPFSLFLPLGATSFTVLLHMMTSHRSWRLCSFCFSPVFIFIICFPDRIISIFIKFIVVVVLLFFWHLQTVVNSSAQIFHFRWKTFQFWNFFFSFVKLSFSLIILIVAALNSLWISTFM